MKAPILLAGGLAAGLLFTGLSFAQQDMHGGSMGSMEMSAPSGARAAYEEAMDRMHGPMMEGITADDPDVAFVQGMIPHHQGAIDMAKVVLEYGDDPEIRKLAEDIVSAQESEIAFMKAWLERNK